MSDYYSERATQMTTDPTQEDDESEGEEHSRATYGTEEPGYLEYVASGFNVLVAAYLLFAAANVVSVWLQTGHYGAVASAFVAAGSAYLAGRYYRRGGRR